MSIVTSPLRQPLHSRPNNWMNWVENHAGMRPDAPALRFLGVTTTWKQLDERSKRLADGLYTMGVRQGDRVLLLTLNCTEFFEAVLAINHLGALAVPVNFRLAPPELAYLIKDSGAKLAFVQTPLSPLLAAARAEAHQLEKVIEIGPELGGTTVHGNVPYEDLIHREDPRREHVFVGADDECLVLYTSGTSGRPKGAVLTHSNIVAQSITCIRAMRYYQDDNVGFLASPVFHVAALGSMAPMIMLGGLTVIHPLKEFNSTEMLDAWEREGVTTTFCVPTQWQAICADPTLEGRDLKLRVISWGAAPATDAILRAMNEKFPDALNVCVFGQTEMSPITTVLDGDDAIRKLGSVGKVIPTIQARIIDDEGNEVPDGEVGEIVYRGPTMMTRYWNNAKATAEAFEGGWFHSGDLVRRDEEGFIYIVDRKKDMIISGGENIYCAEVENALAERPAILESAVIGRKDDKWGEIPVAVVVPKPGSEVPSVDELREFLDGRIARYKFPREVIASEALPRNAAGKVEKHTLRAAHV
ncbi:long-chain-fatty-acid--CoA ligase [Corynebacterium hansenii]|uniref:Long-chain-fatty-acid--CoA ligase n=1 Tax=Corynebacterium hansenii TaxID=394964 RepID=A0ABV7ZN64_9CORY|nr:long-chain-fatty-acid--CoA ligase [Corynebacterium hansenii]WJY99462.1 Long-chain-fatty-acid--CoA ligase FadD13 [Corynebacterium hansenii]